MSSRDTETMSSEELDWIQLRKELEGIRGQEKPKSFLSKETWYLPAGTLLTVICFGYGLYHWNHPTKSVRGAYARIFAQAMTGIGAVHVFFKFSEEGRPKKVKMEYTD